LTGAAGLVRSRVSGKSRWPAPPRAIANTHDLGGQFHRRNRNYALSHRSQRSEAVIGVADDTGN
jgi:hypothetical protein